MSDHCDLYVIGHKHAVFGHAVKVGIARNVQDRLRTFQTANVEELKLYFSFTFESRGIALEVERLFHETELAGHVRGEWVGADPVDVIFYLSIITASVLSRRYSRERISDVRRACGLLHAFEITDEIPGDRQQYLNDQFAGVGAIIV